MSNSNIIAHDPESRVDFADWKIHYHNQLLDMYDMTKEAITAITPEDASVFSSDNPDANYQDFDRFGIFIYTNSSTVLQDV
jgi:hypothetical protein